MIGKLMCFFGWHHWSLLWDENEEGYGRTVWECQRCRKEFKEPW